MDGAFAPEAPEYRLLQTPRRLCFSSRRLPNSLATLAIDDGNGEQLGFQYIEWTDFPLPEIELFACWAGHFWVVMLPSEY